jgi:hypothetical protein
MMPSPFLRNWVATLALVSSVLFPSLAMSQWRVRAEVGADRFWGGAQEEGGEGRSVTPYRPTTWGLALERRGGGKAGFALQLRYEQASLAVAGGGAAAVVEGVFSSFTASPELVYRVLALGPNTLRLHIGPVVEIWDLLDSPTRARFGGQTGLSLSIPLGGRFEGSLIGGFSVIPSIYDPEDLPETYSRQALWRRHFGVGLEYRL